MGSQLGNFETSPLDCGHPSQYDPSRGWAMIISIQITPISSLSGPNHTGPNHTGPGGLPFNPVRNFGEGSGFKVDIGGCLASGILFDFS